jgi:hypothetical protein
MRHALIPVMLWFLLSACAVGNQYDYRADVPELAVTSSGAIAVGVQDKRRYIVSGDKSPNFVGLQRGGFGNPFDVTTQSGAPLASDFADTIVDALAQKGITATAVTLEPQSPRNPVIRALAGAGGRSLLVTLNEWKSDNFVNVALIYNLSAEVFDAAGNVVAENRLTETDSLGAGGGLNLSASVGGLVGRNYKRILETLLNDEKIVAALAAATSDSKVASAPTKSAAGSPLPPEPGLTSDRDGANSDSSQTAVANTTQSARSTVAETSEADRKRVMWFIRNNDNLVKSRLASYNESKRIGRENSTAFNIIVIDHIFARTVDDDRATVELGFSAGYLSFPSYHKYLYDVRLLSGDIVFLKHQKL